ncbi:MAG TPA: RNA polymerase sigma factor region1.1 domain-containing protein, partial [Gemmataceae bacterium]|nr:RNA polymerase sigma factor region1.1 domain-containing protein [Gemmataceae bacterium]
MDIKLDEGLKTLLESGKDKGYLTYSQVNDYLPDDAVNPEKLDQLLLVLEEHGIELIDEAEAEEREAGPDPNAEDERADLDLQFLDDEDSRRIDDPVRMYLTQMGEIPLLKRDEEISLAKKIEVTRKRFRRKVLECDYALSNVVDTLKRVHTGDLPFDRTVKVSLTENLEKDKILQRMPHNLKTLEHLLEQNVEDFTSSLDPRTSDEDRRKLRRSLRIRRRKAVTLVEELSIRTQKVQPLMKKLEQISVRMDELERQIIELDGQRAAKEDRANLEKELRDLMLITLEDPFT